MKTYTPQEGDAREIWDWLFKNWNDVSEQSVDRYFDGNSVKYLFKRRVLRNGVVIFKSSPANYIPDYNLNEKLTKRLFKLKDEIASIKDKQSPEYKELLKIHKHMAQTSVYLGEQKKKS